MREYYIRREGDEDASGPFDIDQISSLIEANKLDANAYYYDIETESWLLISSNQELMDTLFPKKRKLTLRTPEVEAEKKRQAEEEAAKAAAEATAAAETGESESSEASEEKDAANEPPPLPVEEGQANPESESENDSDSKKKDKKQKSAQPEERKKLEVTHMLAQAEGRADDPSGKSPREKQAAVAYIGLRLLTVFLLTSILAMAFIEKDLIMTADAIAMAKSPFILIALFDVAIVVTLLLQVTEVYPLLRFRAAIGAGLLTLLFYSSGDTIPLLANLLLMLSIYFTSAIIKIRFLIGCGLCGLAGVLAYVYAFFIA